MLEKKRYYNFEYKDLIYSFSSIFEIYLLDKYGSGAEVEKEWEQFEKNFNEDEFAEFAQGYELTQDDKDFMDLSISKSFRDGAKSIVPVIFRAQILDYYGADFHNTLDMLLEKHSDLFIRYKVNTSFWSQLFSDKPYGKDLSERLDEEIEKTTENRFNDGINCGGYALKVDRYVFPFHVDNFAKKVTAVLETFPFTRLLGDTDLGEDEYLVIYRALNSCDGGHHFIRVDSDGTVREKDGPGRPQIFAGWHENLDTDDVMEAVFAVKKEHEMFDIDSLEQGIIYDFEERVGMAIAERKNDFDYHGHRFHLKKGTYGEIIVLDDNEEFIADVVSEDNQCLVEITDKKIDYVENNCGKIKPIIENGKLMNYDQIACKKRGFESQER